MSNTLVEFFNGTSWSIQTTPTLAGGGGFNSVAVVSPTDVWAVGSRAERQPQLIEHFNGTSWSVVASPDAGDGGHACSASRRPRHRHLRRRLRRKGQFPASPAIQRDDVDHAGEPADRHCRHRRRRDLRHRRLDRGRRQHLEFQRDDLDRGRHLGGNLVAISGSSANDLYAVGETISTTDETLVEQWNGTSWSTVTSAGAGELNGVTTLSNGTAVAVGAPGIETNATTAAPASSVATTGGSASSRW